MFRTRYHPATLRHLDRAASLINVGVAHHRSGTDPSHAARHYADAVESSLRFAECCSCSGKHPYSERVGRLRRAAEAAMEVSKRASGALKRRRDERLSCLIGVCRRSEPISISRGYDDDSTSLISHAAVEARSDEDCAIALFNSALLSIDWGRYDEAENLLNLALECSAAVTSSQDDATKNPSDVSIASIENLGYALYLQGRYSASSSAYESMVKHGRRRIIETIRCRGVDDDSIAASAEASGAVRNLVRCMTSLARTYDALGRTGEAALLVDEASYLLSTVEPTKDESASSSSEDLLALTYVQALVRQNMREYDSAVHSYQTIVAATTKESASGSSNAMVLRAASLHGIGECLLLQQRRHSPREAELYLLSALTLRRKTLGECHEDTADTTYLIGKALHRREEYADAVSCYERAMDSWIESGLDGGDTNVVLVLRDRARAHRSRNDLGGALASCQEALDSLERSCSSDYDVIESCPVRASLCECLMNMEMDLLEEMERTQSIFQGGEAQRRTSKPGSYTNNGGGGSYGWNGRCPDAAAA